MGKFKTTTKKLIKRVARNWLGPEEQAPSIFNEAVNFEKRCIFIAIPKTGTTSVRRQLRPQGIPFIADPHLDILQVRDSLYVYLLKRTLGGNRTFPTESVPRDADLRAEANEIFKNFFKFSAVRNPWARAVSLYFRREGVQVRDELTFEEFCDRHFYASDTCIHPTLHKNQLDWLCDESGRCLMDYVYKLENFDKAIKEIEDLTDGRIKLDNRKANQNPQSRSQDYREFHTDKTRKIIADRFQKDIDYFKYTF